MKTLSGLCSQCEFWSAIRNQCNREIHVRSTLSYTICTKTTNLKLGGFETLAGIQADHLQPLDWLFHYILRLFVEIDCLAEHFDTAPDRTRTWHKSTTHFVTHLVFLKFNSLFGGLQFIRSILHCALPILGTTRYIVWFALQQNIDCWSFQGYMIYYTGLP